MRIRALAAAITCASIPLATSTALAAGPTPPAPQGFAVDTFQPAPRGSDWFVLDSLDLREDARGSLGVVGEYAYKPLVVSNADGTDRAAVVNHQLLVHAGAGLVILERLRLWFDVPFAVWQDGTSTSLGPYSFSAPTKPATADSRFGMDLRIFGRYGEVVTGAIGFEGIAPTGSRSLYTSDGTARFLPKLQIAGVKGPIEWAVKGGILVRVEDDPIAGQARGDAAVFGGAIGYRTRDHKLTVGPEIYGSASLNHASSVNTPLEALLGVHYFFARAWRVGVGAGPGIGSGLGEPLFRTALSLEYFAPADEDAPRPPPPPKRGPRDHDGDRIPDAIDACPDVAGVATDDPATNGCPPPPDTDKDGIADNVDACPEEPGSRNADPELNGCPPDADADGIPDKVDACPLKAGIEQSDPKQNGCPPDSDRDGILDAEDACPDVAGAKSTNPDLNGCPLDADGDGIQNDDDACPREPGPSSPDPKKNGCPMAVLKGKEIRILDQVRFDPASARIAKSKDGDAVLRAVAKVMIEHPEIKKLEVQGHTDNRGDPKANKRLSEQRAQAVVRWLVSQGLDGSRFTAVGYGDERPIEPNTTDEGRKANRRVELHVIDTEAK